jgi:hypothetical protein
MNEAARMTQAEFHRKTAVKTFNAAWEFLDKKERTPEEQDEMVRLAQVSRWHWGKVGTPVEFVRGDQFLSKIYATLADGVTALRYARRALDACVANNISDFDIAFVYQSLGEAHQLLGNGAEAARYNELARDAGTKIAKPEDRDYFMSQLKAPGR